MEIYKDLIYTDKSFRHCLGTKKELKVIDLHPNTEIINFRAFDDIQNVEKIIIGKDLKATGNYIFSDLRNLKYLEIDNYEVPEKLLANCGTNEGIEVVLKNTKRINYVAFSNCKINNINFPDTLEFIGNMAFLYVNFNNRILKLPNNIKRIGMNPFGESSLTDVYIPDSIEQLGYFNNVKYHMTKKTFEKLKLEFDSFRLINDGRVVVEPDLSEFIETHTFKELNDRNLKTEKNLEIGLISSSVL